MAAVDGAPLDVLTNADVRADFDRACSRDDRHHRHHQHLLWLMAAGIVAAIVYVSVLERTSEFATLKAMGTTKRALVRWPRRSSRGHLHRRGRCVGSRRMGTQPAVRLPGHRSRPTRTSDSP